MISPADIPEEDNNHVSISLNIICSYNYIYPYFWAFHLLASAFPFVSLPFVADLSYLRLAPALVYKVLS